MASGYSDLSEIQRDRRTYGSNTKPPKINLLNEKPRRESVIEQQLTSVITRPSMSDARIEQQQVGIIQQQVYDPSRSQNTNQPYNVSISSSSSSSNRRNLSTNFNTPGLDSFHQESGMSGIGYYTYQEPRSTYHQEPSSSVYHQPPEVKTIKTTVSRTTASDSRDLCIAYENLEADLAAKEAKLNKELAYLNQYNSPWSRPKQIREPRREAPARVVRNDPRWVKECPSNPTSRPNSRASSTRSTTEADLMEKATKLLQDAEDLERKPLKKQEILIEVGSRNRRPGSAESQIGSGLHTTVLNLPDHEIDNKSPLPFAYDNFSTLGVRGNIASVGATEPESPYPPIFPTIKRTPSPANYNKHN